MLKLIRTSGAAESGAVAASVIADALRGLPAPVLGVATGSSPLPVYARLGGTGVDWAGVILFGLDEYVGLPPGHEQSYRRFIETHVARPLGVPVGRVHLPDVHGADLDLAAAAYEEKIRRAGGVDLQIVGIGRNGHLAFNEPGSPLDSRTRVVELTADTRAANARFFERADDVPREAMTQGVGTILEARRILLVADGDAKREALNAALHGPVTPQNPASALQLHPDVTVVTDCALEPAAC
jgi:glucosamine-6-phosphate deaminase